MTVHYEQWHCLQFAGRTDNEELPLFLSRWTREKGVMQDDHISGLFGVLFGHERTQQEGNLV